MAVAKTRTILSLDRYAKIMGISPMLFNGGGDINRADGSMLFPINNAQNDIWPQYSWQNVDQVSREDLALIIANAEKEIAEFLGYYPAPVWIEGERHELPSHYRPELRHTKIQYDVAGNEVSVKSNFGYFIQGGQRSTTQISGRVAVVYSDPDLDGWNELATITYAIPAGVTDYSELKLYFAGYFGAREYEIRDFKTKVVSGGNIIVTFDAWLLVDPFLYEALPTNNGVEGTVDMNDPSIFVQTVELWREYHDFTKDHVVFYAQNTDDGTTSTQGGFVYQIANDNFVIPVQANYSQTNGAWERTGLICAYPDYVSLWYYSGMRNRKNKHPYSDDYLDDDFAVAIAYLATARLERVFYANNNTTALATYLREYLNESEKGGSFKIAPPDALTNPFGTRRGEWLAWKRISRYKLNQRTGGAL